MGTPQPTDDNQHAVLLVLAVTHGLARFVHRPEDRADVELVAHEWDQQVTVLLRRINRINMGVPPTGGCLRLPDQGNVRIQDEPLYF